jgi:hypothetical protein
MRSPSALFRNVVQVVIHDAEIPAGIFLLALAFYDIFQTILLPRPSVHNRRLLTTLVLRVMWRAWRWVGTRGSRQDRTENVLGVFAPAALIVQLLVYAGALTLGYALLFLGIGDEVHPAAQSFGDAIWFSAGTLVPLSYGDVVPIGAAARAVTIAESATGVGLAALVISLLFSLYGSFQDREKQVVRLDALAGAPPSGVQILETVAKYEAPQRLEQTFDEWTNWTAAVLESHLAYPILLYFRSSHDNEAWLNSFGSVMDAACIVVSTFEGKSAAARMMLNIGIHLAEDFSWYFHLENPGVPGIDRSEFEDARERLLHAGYKCRSADEAWEGFAALRSKYAGPLNTLARKLAIVPAQWIGDRSYVPHTRVIRRAATARS